MDDDNNTKSTKPTLFTGPQMDWTNYLAVRPDYTQSDFYPSLLYAYHDAHAGAYEIAHDAACGPGQVTATLAKKFRHVYGSDPNAAIIHTAAAAATTAAETSNISFKVCTAENLATAHDDHQHGTVDMVTVAEAMPLLDADAALAAFARLLKPRGTLAIWFYGGPIFSCHDDGDDENTEEKKKKEGETVVERVQALFRRITARSLGESFMQATDGGGRVRAGTTILSWLDNIAFDPACFRDVKRVKWNTDRPLLFFDVIHPDVRYVNRIGEGETVEDRRVDRSFWEKETVDFAWAKGFIDAQWPRKVDYEEPEMKTMVEELQRLMDGKVWNASWPVVLLLASKV